MSEGKERQIDVQVVKHIADIKKHEYTVLFKNVSETVELKITSSQEDLLTAYPTEQTFTMCLAAWKQKKL